YPEIISYFSPSLEKILRSLRADGKLDIGPKKEEEQKSMIKVLPQRDMDILDYLYEVLIVCSEKMRTIPPDIFCRIHPFRVKNIHHDYTYFTNYILYTNNKALLDFFLTIDLEKRRFKTEASFKNTKRNVEK